MPVFLAKRVDKLPFDLPPLNFGTPPLPVCLQLTSASLSYLLPSTWMAQITAPESTVGDDVWLSRRRGVPGVLATGTGKSAAQFDGYKYPLAK